MIDIIFNTIARNKILSKDLWSTRIFLNAPDNRRIWCQKILWSLHGGLWWWICNDMPKGNLIRLMSFHLKYWRSEKVPFLILCQLPCRLYDIKFSSKSKKKINKDACEKTKHFFLYFIESFILDIIPASIWELLKSFFKIWFCYRQAGYGIYCKANECSFLYLLDGFDTINFLTPELRNKLHMTTSCLNYV